MFQARESQTAKTSPRRLVALPLLAALGCSTPVTPPAPPPPGSSAAPVASASAPAPPPSAATPALPPIATVPTPFHVIADVDEHRLALLASPRDQVLLIGETFAAELVNDALVRSARLARGLPAKPRSLVVRLAGEWPDPLVIQRKSIEPGARSERSSYRFRTTGWAPMDDAAAPYRCAWHAPDGQVGMLIGSKFERWSGPKSGKIPSSPASAIEGNPKDPSATVDYLEDAACLPDGHTFAVGEAVNKSPPRELRLAAWAPGEAEPTVTSLPAPRACAEQHLPLRYARIGARGPAEIYVLAWDYCGGDRPYLARFDGRGWTLLDVPAAPDSLDPLNEDDGGTSLSVGDDGSVWIIRPQKQHDAYPAHAGELWRRAPDGAWTRVAMPPPPPGKDAFLWPTQIVARAGGDTWALARTLGGPRVLVLRTRAQELVTSSSKAVDPRP